MMDNDPIEWNKMYFLMVSLVHSLMHPCGEPLNAIRICLSLIGFKHPFG